MALSPFSSFLDKWLSSCSPTNPFFIQRPATLESKNLIIPLAQCAVALLALFICLLVYRVSPLRAGGQLSSHSPVPGTEWGPASSRCWSRLGREAGTGLGREVTLQGKLGCTACVSKQVRRPSWSA